LRGSGRLLCTLLCTRRNFVSAIGVARGVHQHRPTAAPFAGWSLHSRLFETALLRVVFFAAAGFDFSPFTLIAAQRFLVAAMIALLPASLSFRLGFGACGVACARTSDSPLMLAQPRSSLLNTTKPLQRRRTEAAQQMILSPLRLVAPSRKALQVLDFRNRQPPPITGIRDLMVTFTVTVPWN